MLDDQQRACVANKQPRLMIVAGPGSGKTRVLTEMIADTVATGEADASRVLAITFTRAAAAEMKSRLKVCGVEGVAAMTFHAFCFEIVCRNWQQLRYKSPSILIYDRSDTDSLLDDLMRFSKHKVAKRRLNHIIDASCRGENVQATETEKELVSRYLAVLREHNAVDYSLIPELALSVISPSRYWTHIFVDEAQDLDTRQHEILVALNPERLVMVGDPDQLIYGWRGAKSDGMRWAYSQGGYDLEVMHNNYRSGDAMVSAANNLISNNSMRVAKEMTPAGPDTRLTVITPPEVDHYLANCVGTSAILGRTHNSLEQLAVNARVVGTRARMLDHEAVKTTLAYFAWPEVDSPKLAKTVLANEGLTGVQILSLEMEARKNGRRTIEVAMEQLEPLRQFYDGIADDGFFERLTAAYAYAKRHDSEAWKALLNAASSFARAVSFEQRTPTGLIGWINQRDAQDDLADDEGTVAMTIHASKGLEFDNVFIVGLDDETMPLARAQGDAEKLEEERRLMFVAMTRAKRNLFLVKPVDRKPSRFFAEL